MYVIDNKVIKIELMYDFYVRYLLFAKLILNNRTLFRLIFSMPDNLYSFAGN